MKTSSRLDSRSSLRVLQEPVVVKECCNLRALEMTRLSELLPNRNLVQHIFLIKPRHELRAQRIGIHGPRSLKPDFIVLCQFRGAGPWGNQGDDSLIRSWMVRIQVLRPVGLFDLCISACWALSVGRPPEVWATKARPPKIFPEGPLEQIVLVWGPCKSF